MHAAARAIVRKRSRRCRCPDPRIPPQPGARTDQDVASACSARFRAENVGIAQPLAHLHGSSQRLVAKRHIICGSTESEKSDTTKRSFRTAIRRSRRHAASMPNYRRSWMPGSTSFFTVNLANRRDRCLTANIDALRAAFRDTRATRPFDVVAIAVMPDHLHCIWTLPEGDADNARRWSRLKALFSRQVPHLPFVGRSHLERRERGIWQRRFWEHRIVDEHDLLRHVDYIHYNPVKHGLVDRAIDWPYSSFRRWVAAGIYPEDWAMSPTESCKPPE